MSARPLHVAAISLHTSPLSVPGSADAGGMNVVVLEQATALARRGHRVDLLTRRADPDAPRVIDVEPNLRLIHLDAGPPRPLAKSDMEQAIAPFTASLDHLLDSSDGPFDVVHAHHWFSGVAALPVTRERGLPLLQSFHSVSAPADSTSLGAGEPAESDGRIAGERASATTADLVVAVSDAEAGTVHERYHVPAERMAVVRPGVDPDAFRPMPPAKMPAEPLLLFAARLQPLKAPDLAIEVLARLGSAHGARLLLAGGASEDFASYPDDLARQAEELGVRDRVEFLGSVSRAELARLMGTSSVLLLPSWSETFGLVALEAQACGTPVIAWRCAGGVAEAIGDGGLVLDSRDADVWAHAVETVLEDADARGRMARSARAFAESRSWAASAADLESVYRHVLDGSPLPPTSVPRLRKDSPCP